MGPGFGQETREGAPLQEVDSAEFKCPAPNKMTCSIIHVLPVRCIVAATAAGRFLRDTTAPPNVDWHLVQRLLDTPSFRGFGL